MSESEKKSFVWWLKTIGEGALWTAGYFATDILQVFPEHTIAHRVAIPIGFLAGFLVRKALGLRAEYQNKTKILPSGINDILDKLPNKLTGEKDSK